MPFIAFKGLDRIPEYHPLTMWRCSVVLISSWTTMAVSYATWSSLKSTKAHSRYRFSSRVTRGKARNQKTGLDWFSKRTGSWGKPVIASRNVLTPITALPGVPEGLVRVSKLSYLTDLNLFYYGWLCDLLNLFVTILGN